jgi:hypothetical protein
MGLDGLHEIEAGKMMPFRIKVAVHDRALVEDRLSTGHPP